MTEQYEGLRNIALVAHGGAGKTSLAEAILFDTGVTNRLGRVEDGNTVMDFEPEELKRNISLSTSFHQCKWKKHTISLMDTPGDQNFFSDTKICMQAADGIVVLIDAADGVKVQTEQAWDFATAFKLPVLIFINKLDRERADLLVTCNSDIFKVSPEFRWSRQGVVRNPSVKKFLFYDLYISPEEKKTIKTDSKGQTLVLKRGETKKIDSLKVKFVDFDQTAHTGDPGISIGAKLAISRKGRPDITITPIYKMAGTSPELIPACLPDSSRYFYLVKMNADEAQVKISVTSSRDTSAFGEKEALIIGVTKEPFINFVWLGIIMIVFGSGYSSIRRLLGKS